MTWDIQKEFEERRNLLFELQEHDLISEESANAIRLQMINEEAMATATFRDITNLPTAVRVA